MKIIFLLLLCPLSFMGFTQTYDLIILGGKIIDGSGNPWYQADIGVKNGKIISIGKLDGQSAQRTIQANGLIIAPGFIDVHSHIEGGVLRNPEAANFIHDGVTTVVTGNCGGSNLEIEKYFRRLDSAKVSINVATLIGHNTVRRAVMGDAMRKPTADEQHKMQQLVEAAMKEGAVGLSTGLIYVPGTYAETDEIVSLAKIASDYGGVYSSHIRDEGDEVAKAVEEAINIGRLGKIPVQISHFKVTYKPNFGKSKGTLAQVEAARKEGINVTIDQYPYVASSTTLDQTLPVWVFSGGRDSLKYRLGNPSIRKRIKNEMLEMLSKKQLKNFSYAVVARYPADTTWNGKNISEINVLKGRKPGPSGEAETILEMVNAVNLTQMIFFSMDDADLERIIQYPYNMTASDAGIVTFGSGVPHPRAYGTNARVLGLYVRDKKLIRLEEAVRRMTSLPALKFNFRDRGLIREGMAADLVIFDENTVKDVATFTRPHQYSIGFKFVIVNGAITLDNGKHNGSRNGITLKHSRF